MTKTQENIVVQVPQPLIHFPCFFVDRIAEKGFFYTKPNAYGDLVSIQAPQTPRVREMAVFLSALAFVETVTEDEKTRRIALNIPLNAWRKTAGFGRTDREKKSFREAVDVLSKVVFSIEVGGAIGLPEYVGVRFQRRTKPVPFTRAVFPGLFGDVEYDEDSGVVRVNILRDFVENLDVRALRVSLTHINSMRGNISKLLTYIMYGRAQWAGTWDELAELVHITDWSEKRKQKQSLKKALTEMNGHGFTVQIGKERVKIIRGKTLKSMFPM